MEFLFKKDFTLLMIFVRVASVVGGGGRKSGCTSITEIGLKTAKCINLNLVKVPTNVETDVQILHLLKNQITSLEDDSFAGLYSLQSLHLSENWISFISETSFESLQNLQSLYLDSNMLKEVPRVAFKHLKQLRILNLGYNPISRIRSDDFSYLLNLETLKFENCQITSIDPSSFDWLPQLYEINIIGNLLEGLNWRLKTSLKKVSVLRLHNNPWECDCRLKWLRRAVETIPNWSFGDNSPVCHAPPLLSGVYWKHLNAEQFACPSVIVTTSEQHNNSTNLELQVGSNASLECNAWGDPIPQIVWLKGNEKIDVENYAQESVSLFRKSNEVDIENWKKGVKSVLSLVDFRKSDKDHYKCVAENSAGRAEVTYHVWANEKKTARISESTELKLNLTFEVIVGIMLGCFLLAVSLLFCVVLAINKQKKGKKILKRRYSDKKHQQLLSNENEKDVKRAEKGGEWCGRFFDASLEYGDETKESTNLEDNINKVSFKNSLSKKIHIGKNNYAENNFHSSDIKRISRQKENHFLLKSNKYLSKKSHKKNNKPDILNNDIAAEADTGHSMFNIKRPQQSNPLHESSNTLSCSLTTMCHKLPTQHHATTTSLVWCSPTTPVSSMQALSLSNKADTRRKHFCGFSVTSDTERTPNDASSSLAYDFPNADKVPLKTILKQPSKIFNEKNDRLACLTIETLPTVLTTPCQLSSVTSTCQLSSVTSTCQHYPQKNGRPPDIYATLPSRMSGNKLESTQAVTVPVSTTKAVSGKVANEKYIVSSPGDNRDKYSEKEFKTLVKKLPEDPTKTTLQLGSPSHLRQTPTHTSHLPLSAVSYSAFPAPEACIRRCITPNNNACLQANINCTQPPEMFHSIHTSAFFQPSSLQAVKGNLNSLNDNYPNVDPSSTNCGDQGSNGRHYKFSSPQHQSQQHTKCYTSSHDVRQVEGTPRRGGQQHNRTEVSSSTSLHDILSPPFKRTSPQNGAKQNATKLNHPDFGTAV